MAARGALLALLGCALLALALSASVEKHRHDDGLEVDALDFADGKDFDDFDLSDMKPSRRHHLSRRHERVSDTKIRVKVHTQYGGSRRRGRQGAHWKKWKRRSANRRRRARKASNKMPHRYDAKQRRVLSGFLTQLGKYVSKVPTVTRKDLGLVVQKLADKYVHKTCKKDFRPAQCLLVLQKFFFGDKNATHWSQKKALFLSGSHKFRANCCGASHCCVRETNMAASDSYQNTRRFKKNLEHMLGITISKPKPKNPYASAAKRRGKGKGKKGKKPKVKDPEEKPYKMKRCKDVKRPTGSCKSTATPLLNAFVRRLVRRASTSGPASSDVDSNQLLGLARLLAKERSSTAVRRKRSLRVRRRATKISKSSSVTVNANANGNRAVGGRVNVNSPGIQTSNTQQTINIYQENRARA